MGRKTGLAHWLKQLSADLMRELPEAIIRVNGTAHDTDLMKELPEAIIRVSGTGLTEQGRP